MVCFLFIWFFLFCVWNFIFCQINIGSTTENETFLTDKNSYNMAATISSDSACQESEIQWCQTYIKKKQFAISIFCEAFEFDAVVYWYLLCKSIWRLLFIQLKRIDYDCLKRHLSFQIRILTSDITSTIFFFVWQLIFVFGFNHTQ